MRKPSVLIIFFTVFMDLVGFGIVVPLIPLYSQHFGAHGLLIGVIIASFSFMQFIFAPIWGRLSDRHGRRPILLISTAGAAASYALFGVASGMSDHRMALTFMIVSRMLAGLCGGNITVAQAYIADITPPESRSKKMGLVGMAFGLGFIFGPAIGGISYKYLGITGPGWIASGFCALNFVLAWMILVESRQGDDVHAPQRPHLAQWGHTLSQPKIGLLVFVFFLATFCFSCFESTLPLVVGKNFGLDPTEHAGAASTVSYIFVYCGLIGAFVQGGLTGRLVKKLGEPKLITLSLILTGISLAFIPFIRGNTKLTWGVVFSHEGGPWLALLGVLAILSIGSSLTRPPLFGMLSNLTPRNEQGATIGVAQGAGSLARILGPIFANGVLLVYQPGPYLACTAVLLVTTLLVVRGLCMPSAAGQVEATAGLAK